MNKLVIRNWSWIFWDYFDTQKIYWQDTQHFIDLFRKDYNVMATQKPKNTSPRSNPAQWVNATITGEHAEEINALVAGTVDPMEYILRCVADGISFSVKYRNDKNDYIAYFFEPDSDNPNQSYGLSAYATDIRTALIVLCFKHDVILRGYAGNGNSETSTFG